MTWLFPFFELPKLVSILKFSKITAQCPSNSYKKLLVQKNASYNGSREPMTAFHLQQPDTNIWFYKSNIVESREHDKKLFWFQNQYNRYNAIELMNAK